MKLNRDAAKKALIDALAPAMNARGLEAIKGHPGFIEPAGPPIRRMYSFSFASGDIGTEFRPAAGFRIDAVQDLLQKVEPKPKAIAATCATLSVDLGRFSDTWMKWARDIATEEDAQRAAHDFVRAFDEEAIPFYQATSTLTAFDALCNQQDDPGIALDHVTQAKLGLALAVVLERGDWAEVLARHKMRMQEAAGGAYWPNFNAYVQGLQRLGYLADGPAIA